MKKIIVAFTILLSSFALTQDKPQSIDKKDLPKTAVATFCGSDGKTELERPNVGFRYKGEAYYFCDKPGIDAFLKAPDAFLRMKQDRPTDIAKKDLPKEAECTVCSQSGEGHGKEKPAGGVMYKGTAYYFCNAKEIAAFKKDPEAYMPPVLPRPMPEFSLADTTGKTWDQEAMKGKLVLLDFWATWCGPCKAMFPALDKLHAKYSAKGFELLSVSVDAKRADLDKFLKGHKFPNPVLHDTQGMFGKWGVRSIPATFLLKDGQIIAQWSGKQSEKTLDEAIAANLTQ